MIATLELPLDTVGNIFRHRYGPEDFSKLYLRVQRDHGDAKVPLPEDMTSTPPPPLLQCHTGDDDDRREESATHLDCC